MMLVWQIRYEADYAHGCLREAEMRPKLWLDGTSYDCGPWLMFWNGKVGLA